MQLRAFNNYDVDQASLDSGLECLDPSRAQQHQKEESDINTIVRRFGLTGELPTNVRAPQYGDFTAVGTYQEALNAVKAADAAFMQFPWDIRARFNNDPETFVAFCSDEKNRAEMVKLGLIVETEPATPPAAVPPATPPIGESSPAATGAPAS